MTATTSFECSLGLISVFMGRFKMCDMHDSDWKLLNIFQAPGLEIVLHFPWNRIFSFLGSFEFKRQGGTNLNGGPFSLGLN